MAFDRVLLDFVSQLRERQQNLLARFPENHPLVGQLKALTPSLLLAKAALEKQVWLSEFNDLPLQIAVVGPTQAGKSSLVNLILGQQAAKVSPLAGFTVHPQAFLHGMLEVPGLERFFEGFTACNLEDLPKNRYDCFGIARVNTGRLPPCVVWDTPDFDSLRAREYLSGVLRTVALADLLVVVVSKDKYADQSVWNFLSLVEELKQPTLVVINKVLPASRNVLLSSFAAKWRKVRKDPCPSVLTLDYVDTPEAMRSLPLFESLLPLCHQALKERRKGKDHAKELICRYFAEWSAPIRAEIEAQKHFKALTKDALDQALAIYHADFLDHPVVYATLHRLQLKLLTLLEIPVFARPMMAIRRTLTWPLKALLGRNLKRSEEVHELLILQRAVEHALLKLSTFIRDQIHSQNLLEYWWREIERGLSSATPSLLQSFKTESLRYYQAFEPKIEAAALRLYQRLKEQPATLNSLRAARAGTDVAGLTLLFHTGGIGPHDVVLAPAMLSLTSFLAESALGKYLEKVAAELKREQLQAVKTLLDQLAEKIIELEAQLDPSLRLGFSESFLSQVEAELRGRTYVLKLFSGFARADSIMG